MMAYLHSQLRIPISVLGEWQVRQTQRQEGAGALNYYYRPQRSCEGYVFTGVCLSTGGGVHDQVHPPGPGTPPGTRCTPWDQEHPPGPGTPPLPRTRYTPQAGTPPGTRYTPPPDQVHPPPRYGHCCRQYASYWNAFFFGIIFAKRTA